MNDIQRILFLTYLTNYNINEINSAYKFKTLNDFVEEFLKLRALKGNKVADSFITETHKLAEYHYEEMKFLGIKFIPTYNETYPVLLKKISQYPPLLYYKGNIRQTENIAIVGSRSISKYAKEKVDIVVNGLDPNVNGVVSGLALGIDELAHKAALNKGIYTIAILANALNSIYPKENIGLANRILENNGALISELPIGINRGKKSFVERNRLQTGISKYVIPIEFSQKSGTMHTIDFCARQERILLNFTPTKEEEQLPQYQGFNLLKNKKSIKRITITKDFNLKSLESKNKDQPNQLTLFDK